MKHLEKAKSRPRTLSEIRKEDQHHDAVLELAAPNPTEHCGPLIAAQRIFCYSWGDDGYDPFKREIVGIYRSKTEAERGVRNGRVESSLVYTGGPSEFDFLEVPVADDKLEVSIEWVYVVFKAHYLNQNGYNDDVWREHTTYRTDWTGKPLLAFSSHPMATEHALHLTQQQIMFSPWLTSWQHKGDVVRFGEPYLYEYGGKLSEFTSLSEPDFRAVLNRIGIQFVEELKPERSGAFPWRFTNLWGRFDTPSLEQEAMARALWPHLDRLVLFKVVPMPIL